MAVRIIPPPRGCHDHLSGPVHRRHPAPKRPTWVLIRCEGSNRQDGTAGTALRVITERSEHP